MNSTVQELTLGFYNEAGIYTVYAKQGDTNRQLHVQFADTIQQYLLEDVTYVYIKGKTSNGTILPPILIPNDCISEDKSEMTYTIDSILLSVPGITECEVSIMSCDEMPEFDEEGVLVNENYQILTTDTFNIYVEANVQSTGELTPSESQIIKQLLPLVVGAQQLIDHDSIYTANEEIRTANELTRTNNEVERVNAENERKETENERNREEQHRIANEGRGTYLNPEDIDYIDQAGDSQTVRYQDSRVGTMERIKAINDGGFYIDDDGTIVEIKNEYVNYEGETVEADLSDYEGMSYKAIAASMGDSVKQSEKYHILAKSYANGDTGIAERPDEDTDNSMYYSKLAKSWAVGGTGIRDDEDTDSAKAQADRAQTISDNIDGSLKPMGPILFENLPNNPRVGWMYQAMNDFVTDDRFIEGAGVQGYVGDEIYFTNQNKWSVFLGRAVRGVKGAAEDDYRTGEVSLSAKNVGAIPDVSEDAMIGQTVIYDGEGWVPGDTMPDGLLDGNVEFTDLQIGTRDTTMYSDNPFTLTNGRDLSVLGYASHAEGDATWTDGAFSHAEGVSTTANGEGSHAEGIGTVARQPYQHVTGMYNSNKIDTLFEVGNGNYARIKQIQSEISELDPDGDAEAIEDLRIQLKELTSTSNAFEVTSDGYIRTKGGTTKIAFGIDANGNYGYIKDGADTVTPFKNPQGTKTDTITTAGTFTYDVTDYANHQVVIKAADHIKKIWFPKGFNNYKYTGDTETDIYAYNYQMISLKRIGYFKQDGTTYAPLPTISVINRPMAYVEDTITQNNYRRIIPVSFGNIIIGCSAKTFSIEAELSPSKLSVNQKTITYSTTLNHAMPYNITSYNAQVWYTLMYVSPNFYVLLYSWATNAYSLSQLFFKCISIDQQTLKPAITPTAATAFADAVASTAAAFGNQNKQFFSMYPLIAASDCEEFALFQTKDIYGTDKNKTQNKSTVTYKYNNMLKKGQTASLRSTTWTTVANAVDMFKDPSNKQAEAQLIPYLGLNYYQQTTATNGLGTSYYNNFGSLYGAPLAEQQKDTINTFLNLYNVVCVGTLSNGYLLCLKYVMYNNSSASALNIKHIYGFLAKTNRATRRLELAPIGKYIENKYLNTDYMTLFEIVTPTDAPILLDGDILAVPNASSAYLYHVYIDENANSGARVKYLKTVEADRWYYFNSWNNHLNTNFWQNHDMSVANGYIVEYA